MKTTLCLFFSLFFYYANAQVEESFTDGDYTQNPTWYGNPDHWSVTGTQLQSNNTNVNSSFFISTFNSLSDTAEWSCTIDLTFNPSGLNYVDVYLNASDTNLLQPALTGYFVRLGNTDDEISLYRKDAGGIVKIIDGLNGVLNNSSNSVTLKVIRYDTQHWELNRSVNVGGWYHEGTAMDATYHQSVAFGILIRQSTAGFFKKHFFDELSVKKYLPDTLPPVWDSIALAGNNMADLFFNEALDSSTAMDISHYEADQAVGQPTYVLWNQQSPDQVRLVFPYAFPERTIIRLSVSGLKDKSGNSMPVGEKTLLLYKPLSYDILIDEIMADPSPPLGFPEAEWIELRNISPFCINLKNWKISKQSECSGPMPDFILAPDSSVVICSSGSLAELLPFAPALALSGFPALTNTEDLICLLSPEGKTIHAVHYSDDWYGNALKKLGGWSLEMIDYNNPCNGASNWSASVSMSGATPGKINSVDAINVDETSPELVHAYTTDSLNVVLCFNETLDSAYSVNPSFYTLDQGIGHPISVSLLAPEFNKVLLRLYEPIRKGLIYEIKVTDIRDCIHNTIGIHAAARIGLSEPADSSDLVINEILFNPESEGADYLELFNRSKKIINLKEISVANRNTLDELDNISPLSKTPRLMFPGDYFVFTTDIGYLKRKYFTKNPESLIAVDALPSFNDDEGNVILLNGSGTMVDELHYLDDWQDPVLSIVEGVALERINTESKTDIASNWHSASSASGYGTPGYKNSQSVNWIDQINTVEVLPKSISPDNDGMNDIMTIHYKFDIPGNLMNVSLYDLNGHLRTYIAENQLCGTSGSISWKGTDQAGKIINRGFFIVYSEVIDSRGRVLKFKHPVLIN